MRYTLFRALPDSLAQTIGFAAVLMPVSVAYAVFQYRVIDVNFVINRAIVYGVLTVLLAAAVSLLDWLLGKILGGAHLHDAASKRSLRSGLALRSTACIKPLKTGWTAFSFGGGIAPRRISGAWPPRCRLQLPTKRLPTASCTSRSKRWILTGAALYRRAENSADFEFVAAWRASPMSGRFDANDNLVRFLQSEENAVWLDELGTQRRESHRRLCACRSDSCAPPSDRLYAVRLASQRRATRPR